MKIFRGPSSKSLQDDSHELVSEVDTAMSGSFIDGSVVLVANITKEPTERQAVAHIEFDAEDILSLHRRLLTGLASQSKCLALANARMTQASQELYALWETLNAATQYSEPEDRLADLESRLSEACDIVGTLASELDNRNLATKRDA